MNRERNGGSPLSLERYHEESSAAERRFSELAQRVALIEGRLEQAATKEDVANAKSWMQNLILTALLAAAAILGGLLARLIPIAY